MKNLNLIIVITAMLFASCAKDGETGPAGPAGVNGNANVQSFFVSVASTEWVYAPPQWTLVHAMPEITQDVIDNGFVLIYEKMPGGEYAVLPFWYTTLITFNVNNITIIRTGSPGGGAPAAVIDYKIVIASGYPKSGHVNYNNYDEVKAYYHL